MPLVGEHRPDAVTRRDGDADVIADEPAQHRREAGDDSVEVEHSRRQALLAAEREELSHERRSAHRRMADRLDVGALHIAGGDAGEQQVAVAGDDGEQVVEVVGDAAGELADRLHLLRLAEALLQQLVLGDVRPEPDSADRAPLAVADHGGREVEVHHRPVAPPAPNLHAIDASVFERGAAQALELLALIARREGVRLADHFLGAPAEDALGRGIPPGHDEIGVDADDPERRDSHERLEPVVRGAQTVLALLRLHLEPGACRYLGAQLDLGHCCPSEAA